MRADDLLWVLGTEEVVGAGRLVEELLDACGAVTESIVWNQPRNRVAHGSEHALALWA